MLSEQKIVNIQEALESALSGIVEHQSLYGSLTAERIDSAYDALAAATHAKHLAGKKLADATGVRELEDASALSDGKIDGKNVKEREAQLQLVNEKWYKQEHIAKDAYHEASNLLKQAELEVERIRLHMRRIEIQQRRHGAF